MIRNRNAPVPLPTLSYSERECAERRFDLYVRKKWHYVGGNHGEHWTHFTILCKNHPIPKREDSCYLCQRPMNPRRIYYIKRYEKENRIQQIGKCCYWMYDRFHEKEPFLYPHERVKQKME
jgi:hypothetical protein